MLLDQNYSVCRAKTLTVLQISVNILLTVIYFLPGFSYLYIIYTYGIILFITFQVFFPLNSDVFWVTFHNSLCKSTLILFNSCILFQCMGTLEFI